MMTYESYLSYMEHIAWKGSGYRVMTEEEFLIVMDWIGFVTARQQFQAELEMDAMYNA